MKRDDDITTSKTQLQEDAASYKNTHGDVPMSILQQKHTANTQHNHDNFHYKHDCNHNNQKGRKEQQQERDKKPQQHQKKMKEDYSEMSFDIIHKCKMLGQRRSIR